MTKRTLTVETPYGTFTRTTARRYLFVAIAECETRSSGMQRRTSWSQDKDSAARNAITGSGWRLMGVYPVKIVDGRIARMFPNYGS